MVAELSDKSVIFIVGVERSGTTWLQLLLSSHPNVATTLETPIFQDYIRPLMESWKKEVDRICVYKKDYSTFNRGGLSFLLSEQRFYKFLREFVLSVYQTIQLKKETATEVVDKYPKNALMIEEIHRIMPLAKFVNVIRDGRDVVCSRMAARKEIWPSFGETNIYDSVNKWKSDVSFCEQKIALLPTSLHMRVRFEDLIANTEAVLENIFSFCDLQSDKSLIDRIIASNTFDALRTSQKSPDPEFKNHMNFYRRGKAGSWKDELRVYEQILFGWVAGDLLVTLGYENNRNWYKRNRLRYILNLPLALLAYLIYYIKSLFKGKDSKLVYSTSWL